MLEIALFVRDTRCKHHLSVRPIVSVSALAQKVLMTVAQVMGSLTVDDFVTVQEGQALGDITSDLLAAVPPCHLLLSSGSQRISQIATLYMSDRSLITTHTVTATKLQMNGV